MPKHTDDPAATPERQPIRQSLLDELERQSDGPVMNIDYLVLLYRKEYPGEAVWMLANDIQRQAHVWYNVAELIKHGGTERLKSDFEGAFGLLPKGALTNPIWSLDLDKAFDKMRRYGKGLLAISQRHALDLMSELNAEAGSAATVQVTLGFPPALAIGFERSFSAAAQRVG